MAIRQEQVDRHQSLAMASSEQHSQAQPDPHPDGSDREEDFRVTY
jgi:hypothetical protein